MTKRTASKIVKEDRDATKATQSKGSGPKAISKKVAALPPIVKLGAMAVIDVLVSAGEKVLVKEEKAAMILQHLTANAHMVPRRAALLIAKHAPEVHSFNLFFEVREIARRGKNSVYSRVSTDISLLGDDGERYYIHNNNSKGYSKGWIPDADGRRMRAYFGGKPLKSFVEAFAAITAAAEGGKGEMGRAEDEEAAVHEEQAKTEVEETERSRRLRPRTAAPAPHHPARKAATPQVQTRSRARGKAVETRSESAVVEGDAPEPAPLKLEAPPSPAAKAPAEAPSPAVETPVAAEAKRRFRFVVGSAMRLKAAAASAEAGAPAVAAAAEAPPQAEANRARVKAPRKRDAAAAGFCMADVVVGAAAQRSRAMASTIPADGELMNNPANEGEACVIGAVDWV